MKTTQLYDYHRRTAKLFDFAGFEMPLWYSSTIEEHMAVRNDAGAFDVSHMGRILISGGGATGLLEKLLPTNVDSQPVGKSFYSLFLNQRGGIIDDVIVMKLSEWRYIVVVNAANLAKDMKHVQENSLNFDVKIDDITLSSAMIAIQGPSAQRVFQSLTSFDLSGLGRFRCTEADVSGHNCVISRTGYTGEDGFEVIVLGPTNQEPEYALQIWEAIIKHARPCGLAARDSLRLEAGYPLYGNELDDGTNPFQAELVWVVSTNKQGYIGCEALAHAREKLPDTVRRGLVLEERIPRPSFKVQSSKGEAIGTITSGTYSPVLKKGIALAYIDSQFANIGELVKIDVRGTPSPARVVRPPFYDETVYGWKRQDKSK